MLKKGFCLILLCALLTGCGAKETAQQAEDGEQPLKIVATVFPAYDFALRRGGRRGDAAAAAGHGEPFL